MGGMMFDKEVTASAAAARKAGKTIQQWQDALQARTADNAAYDKWEAAINLAQDVLEAGGDWAALVKRLSA